MSDTSQPLTARAIYLGTYCLVPVASLTAEMVEASTAGTLDCVAVSPGGRVVLRYRGEPHPGAARFVTRDQAGALAWLAARPEAALSADEQAAAVAMHREALR